MLIPIQNLLLELLTTLHTPENPNKKSISHYISFVIPKCLCYLLLKQNDNRHFNFHCIEFSLFLNFLFSVNPSFKFISVSGEDKNSKQICEKLNLERKMFTSLLSCNKKIPKINKDLVVPKKNREKNYYCLLKKENLFIFWQNIFIPIFLLIKNYTKKEEAQKVFLFLLISLFLYVCQIILQFFLLFSMRKSLGFS